ncbi:hypothetical protein DBR41_30510 [Pseudomonas sp. HMWF010]|nr:hypothetical protein DBR21_13770 [Caulobacter sp. HMWF009]PTT71386.1 hypothetical protein DBR41_30510 [Pseudomonas sp. HMWF010]
MLATERLLRSKEVLLAICCFCERAIPESNIGAVSISLVAMWISKDPPAQELFAHSVCLGEKFAATLGPSIPFDAEAFGD